MSYVRDEIDAHVREKFEDMLQSTFIQSHPLFYAFGLTNQEGLAELGSPKTALVFGGANVGQAEAMQMVGSMENYVTYQKSEPNDGSAVEYGGETPVASEYAEDNMGMARTRWTHIQEPLRIRKHSVEFAKGPYAIGSITDKSMAPVLNRFLKRINTGMLQDELSSADDAKYVWQKFQSVEHVTDSTNNTIFGGVDRSVETELASQETDASADLSTTLIDLDINRYVNVSLEMADKDPEGVGCNLFLTGSTLMRVLMEQADTRFTIHQNGIPNHAIGGFRHPIIEKDNVYYMWCKDVPDNTIYGLNTPSWIIEVAADHNFQWSGLKDKSETEEGGEYHFWGFFDAMLRLTCRRPDLQWKGTNFTAT